MGRARAISRRLPGAKQAAKAVRLCRASLELWQFAASSANARPEMPAKWEDRAFYLNDRTQKTPFDSHYLYHTAWAARQLMERPPAEHVDISSSLYFVGLASAIVPMRHLDLRPPDFKIDNLTCGSGNLLALPFGDNSVSSLSCMHVIEHIGLGRYGDPIDVEGDRKAAAELQRVLAVGGQFLFVAPVGRPRVCFNAHRIYSFQMLQELFPKLRVVECALVEDDPSLGLIRNPSADRINRQSYGCGCIRFTKEP
jgi:hypothetical protein